METERQERCAHGDAWRLAKNIFKLKEKDKATFFSPTDEWSLPAASTIKLEEREFVVDSGASMHIVNRKDLNSAELDTVTVCKNPTTVVTANGEVLTKEEATVYVRDLCLFVTVMLLEDIPAVLSLGKLCEDHGYTYHWTKTTTHQKRQTDRMQHGELLTTRCFWSVDKFLNFIFTYISYIFIAGICNFTQHLASTGSESVFLLLI